MTTNGNGTTELREIANEWIQTGDVSLVERIADLELALANAGWVRFDDFDSAELSLQSIKKIAHNARKFFLKNPLIKRGVNVQTDYVFGRGVNINAKDEDINLVIQRFLDDEKNQVELTSHIAMLQKDREQQLDGNTFLVFFVHEMTGHCRVRSIPLDEIDDIICNPDDAKEPWFYKRVWQETKLNVDDGTQATETKIAYYSDWQYSGTITTIDKVKVESAVVLHIKTGGFAGWKFGVSEQYAALDWARSYKDFLTNWATLMAAYARFAMKVNVQGGARGVSSAKEKLQTKLGTTSIETNPPATTGSTWIQSDQAALDVVKTAGATTKAEEGRRLLLMVAAGQDLPETFYGDVSVGTLATAESLDRPTELKFSNRQEFWQSLWKRIIKFVLECAVLAPSGALSSLAHQVTNEYAEPTIEWADGIDTRINIDFPEIISMSIKDHVASIISAATLDGKIITLLNPRMVTEMLLNALGVDDVDELLDELFPDGIETTESVNLARSIDKLTEAFNNAST